MFKTILIVVVTILANSFYCFNDFYSKNNKSNNLDNYVFNDPDWDKEKFKNYYLDNNIFPASIPDEAKKIITSTTLQQHLNTRFSSYSEWMSDDFASNDVSSTYGGITIDSEEGSDSTIIDAKNNSNIKDYNYIGCGPLAVITQFNFLATYAGYTQFYTSPDSTYQKEKLYIDIFNTIKTYPAEGLLGTNLEQMGIEIDEGTYTFAKDLINGINQLLYDYNINNGIGVEEYYPDGDYRKLLTVKGDSIVSLSSFDSKINKLKSSIDKGMPVIWWTNNDTGDFRNHFMNIFGYETWTGVDEDGNEFSHLFFKVNLNWTGWSVAYMDSDLLNAANSGFIVFEETLPRISISPDDYEFPQAYNYAESISTLSINGISVKMKRLRTGYINEEGLSGTGDWHITMSAKRKDAGEAYLHYELTESINFIYFDIRLWGTSEGINSSNGAAKLQYKDLNGNWVDAIDFFDSSQNTSGLSSLKDRPDKYRYDFPYGTTEFRFYSNAINPTNSTTNKGRIVIGNVGIVFNTNDTSVSNLYLTIFSENNGGSSALNFSGHSWIEIYNNSPQQITIGKYLLPAYEGVTVGLWGNLDHTGVYYNLEYYLALTIIEDRVSNSSSSNSSSSGLDSDTSSSNSSYEALPTWSQGSFGVTSWLYTESRGSIIVRYANDRVSLTEVVNIDYSDDFSNIINTHNDEWWPWYNCSNLAIDIWNVASEHDFNSNIIQTPTDLITQIEGRDDYLRNKNISGCRNKVGYFYNDEFYNYV